MTEKTLHVELIDALEMKKFIPINIESFIKIYILKKI